MMRGMAAFFGVLTLGLALFAACARSGLLTPSDAELRARYALPNSQFIEIDGEPIHYIDEGKGDAIVLIHGSFGSLIMWNVWAKALTDHYRVIRFDRPPLGLSGPDPNGRYDVQREAEIIDGLTTRLGVQRFFLVATSSGGASGAAYAAEHPGQLKGLILSNIAVGPVTMDGSRYSPAFKLVLAIDPVFRIWHPEAMWRGVLTTNFADPGKVTPALVTEWTDLNNRAINIGAARRPRPGGSPFDRTPGDLAKITIPTLLLWSAQDHEVPVKPVADRALGLLASPDKALTVVPNCGHMMPIECGADSVAIARTFFDRVSAGD